MKKNDFSPQLTEFLAHYLPELKNVSENTISAYCDTFRLFLGYCKDVENMSIEKMSLKDLKPELVERFLCWLETERGNSIATRNNRLAAIHSFVRYLQVQEPMLLLNFQRILAIPVKKTERKVIKPLTKEAVATVLRQPDISTARGRRDATILCVLYDTACRVQELCDLRVEDIRFEHPANVRIHGKGRKTRIIPLLPTTAQNLKNYLAESHMLSPEKSHLPLFTNQNGNQLTRSGVAYILNKYVQSAAEMDDSIPQKITPHKVRHTKAMHLFESCENLIHVRDFLGHTDIKTTGIYARSSLAMKKRALETVSETPVAEIPSWQENKDMLLWLKSFGAHRD